jgi:hypothetical protein
MNTALSQPRPLPHRRHPDRSHRHRRPGVELRCDLQLLRRPALQRGHRRSQRPRFQRRPLGGHKIVFPDYVAALATHDADGSGDFETAAEVEAALADGTAVDQGVVKEFVCTVDRMPAHD